MNHSGWNRKQDKDIDILKVGDTKRGQEERETDKRLRNIQKRLAEDIKRDLGLKLHWFRCVCVCVCLCVCVCVCVCERERERKKAV